MFKHKLFEYRLVRWLLVWLIWTLVGLFFASQAYVWYADILKSSISWSRAIQINLPFYYLWALFTPIIFWLAKRFRFERQSIIRALLVHIPVSFILAVTQLIAAQIVDMSFRPYALQLFEEFRSVEFLFAVNFHMNVLTYWIVLAVGYLVEYYHRYREHELHTMKLKQQLTQAELQALKMQLHPHFLFNTLNAISSLMHKNVDDADRVLTRLGDLLRYSLKTVGVQEVTLKEEIDFLQQYLEIEKVRFGRRLKVVIDIPKELLPLKVPNLILQPIVENAIKYAVNTRRSGGMVTIAARKMNEKVHLTVIDNGPGLPSENGTGITEGIGLSNTRARLIQLYGDLEALQFTSIPAKGLEVCIKVPYRIGEENQKEAAAGAAAIKG
ncbi:MAG: histidine kinase [bacterium]